MSKALEELNEPSYRRKTDGPGHFWFNVLMLAAVTLSCLWVGVEVGSQTATTEIVCSAAK